MGNPLVTMLNAMFGKNKTNEEEVRKAEIEGEIAANIAAQRAGIITQTNSKNAKKKLK